MNEATLEARLNKTINDIFPTITPLRIKHQHTFTLRLGHANIVVDGKNKNRLQGRLDVLILIDDKPVLVIELKAPGLGLNNEDRDQVCSYARLLNPMPPLFVTSDGNQTIIYKNHDKSVLNGNSLDESTIQKQLHNASVLAQEEEEEAIKALLSKDPSLWKDIIRRQTVSALKDLKGTAHDLSRPIISEFSITRQIVQKLRSLLEKSEPLIILTGPPLSGKTNILAQLCENPGSIIIPLYIDASSLSYGIWQHVANMFANELFIEPSSEKIRHWISRSLGGLKNVRLILIIDGWLPENGKLRESIEELISHSKKGSFGVLIALETNYYEKLATIPGRKTATSIGRIATKVEVTDLNDREFDFAVKTLKNQYEAVPLEGARYNREYRRPRLYRILASLLEAKHLSSSSTSMNADSLICLPSIVDIFMLDRVWKAYADDPELTGDFYRIAEAFLEERTHQAEPDWIICFEQFGRLVISLDTAEEILGSDRLQRLLKYGYLGYCRTDTRILVIVKTPELLAVAAAHVISKMLLSLADDNMIYKSLISAVKAFPLWDLVGAMAIFEYVRNRPEHILLFINELMADPPIETRLTKGARGVVITSQGPVNMQLNKEVSEVMLGNMQPWLILSHLAAAPIIDIDKDQPINSTIFSVVGASKYFLHRTDTEPLEEIKGFHFHELPGRGSVICGSMGIVEPITQAIIAQFKFGSADLVTLAKWAVQEDRYYLVWRLIAAANVASGSESEEIAKNAVQVLQISKAYWQKTFDSDIVKILEHLSQ